MADRLVAAWLSGRSGRKDTRGDGKWVSRTEMEIFVVTEHCRVLTAVLVT